MNNIFIMFQVVGKITSNEKEIIQRFEPKMHHLFSKVRI